MKKERYFIVVDKMLKPNDAEAVYSESELISEDLVDIQDDDKILELEIVGEVKLHITKKLIKA